MNEPLTPKNIVRIDAELDQQGVFAKQFTRMIDGKVTTVGLRIGVKPNHAVAFFGDTVQEIGDGLFAVQRSSEVTADMWNRVVPLGSRVIAHPGMRDGDLSFGTTTRSAAWGLGHGRPVVKVEGHAGGISLTHVDVVGGAE